MKDEEIQSYLGGLYKKYSTIDRPPSTKICRLLDELREKFSEVRDIPMSFSNNEIHDLHMCISECISFHIDDKDHQKEYGDNCDYCESYKKLYNRIVKKCDCVDSSEEYKLNLQGDK